MIPPNVHPFTLLTGAGFSKPFGGFLASEFWPKLTRHVGTNEKLRQLVMSRDRNFEDALAIARSGGEFTEADGAELEQAVLRVFGMMDTEIAKPRFERNGVNVYGYQRFLQGFQARRQESDAGFIFTLNQDLCVERHWYNFASTGYPPSIPGIPASMSMNREGLSWFSTSLARLRSDHSSVLDSSVHSDGDLTHHTHYVKLHGSMNWRSGDGTGALVIGTGKTEQIERSPLLTWYAEIFHQVLRVPEMRLMVAGYSFRDDHVNRTIAESVKSGLKVFLWDVRADDILDRLRGSSELAPIHNAVSGVWTSQMSEVFPGDQSETTEWLDMQSKFFLRNRPGVVTDYTFLP